MRLVYLFFCCLWLASAASHATPAPARPAVGQGSAEFVQNLGQWPAAVRFAAALHGGQLFAEARALTYVLGTPGPATKFHEHSLVPARAWAYQVQFAGATDAEVSGQQPSGVPHSYFTGNSPAGWASAAAGYGRIDYPALYPAIDLAVYGNAQNQLEYTFTVQPGGQPAAIRLRYAGLTGLHLDSAGRLHLRTPIGSVTELAPVAWQVDPATGQRQPVACAFRLATAAEVSFDPGQYDPARPLIIDPVVQFASFTGSVSDNWGHTASYDAQGNFYSASTLFDYDYPASPGAYDTSFNGSIDVAVIKYAPQASGPAARVWATLLGGQQTDAPHRLTVTAQGEVVVLGSTASGNFPTTDGAVGRTFRGGAAIKPDGISFPAGPDLFVARLSASGNQLLASTLLGGTGIDGFTATTNYGLVSTVLAPRPSTCYGFAGGLQVDATGDVYVATTTGSPSFTGPAGAGSAFGGGTTDAVVLRLAADLRTVRWRQLVGGSGDDAAYDLALSADGLRAYVCGGTHSDNFPVTAGAYAPPTTGRTDGFVLQLATADGRRLAACRLGTDQDDQALLLSLDPAGQVLVAGQSTGQLPISPQHYGLPGKCFLLQLDASLQSVQFSTTFGDYDNSTNFLVPVALRADNCSNIYLALVGNTTSLPVSPGSPGATNHFYAMRLSANGRTLDYALRLPGDHSHSRSTFDERGRLYLATCGDCDRNGSFSVPAGVNTYAAQNGSRRCNDTSLLADLSPANAGLAPPLLTLVCAGASPVLLGGSPAGGIWSGPGVTGSPATGYVFTPTPALVGVQALTYQPPAGSTACTSALGMQVTVGLPTAVTFPPITGSFCADASQPVIYLKAQPTGGYFSGPGVHAGSSSTSAYFAPNELAPGTYTLSYTMPGTNGVCGAATQTVVIKGTRLTVNSDTTLCGAPFRAFQLRGRPLGGTWSGTGVTPSGWFDPALVPAFTTGTQSGFIRVTYTYTGADGCTSVRTVGVFKTPVLDASQLLPAPVCQLAAGLAGYAPYTLRLPLPPAPPAGVYPQYSWDFGDGTGNVTQGYVSDTTHVYTQPGTYAPTLTVSYGYAGTCARTIRYSSLTIGDAKLPPNIITPNGDGLNDTFVQNQFCEPPRLRVFSRWGQQVYQHDAYRSDWGGLGLAPGLYYYLLSDNTGQRAATRGWLELVR